jgi:hypothetical protein
MVTVLPLIDTLLRNTVSQKYPKNAWREFMQILQTLWWKRGSLKTLAKTRKYRIPVSSPADSLALL